MAVLTKDVILSGINNIEEHEIKSLKGSLFLRPLSHKELLECESIEAKAIGTFETNETSRRGMRQAKGTVESKGKIDLAKANNASAKANLRKVFLSINNDKNSDSWSEDEISSLNRDTFNEILDIVNVISGVEVTEQDVDDFH